MQNYCKFVFAQRSANILEGKVEYCDLKNQENSIQSKIKKQLIYAVIL